MSRNHHWNPLIQIFFWTRQYEYRSGYFFSGAFAGPSILNVDRMSTVAMSVYVCAIAMDGITNIAAAKNQYLFIFIPP
jgi:hypothetical protein